MAAQPAPPPQLRQARAKEGRRNDGLEEASRGCERRARLCYIPRLWLAPEDVVTHWESETYQRQGTLSPNQRQEML